MFKIENLPSNISGILDENEFNYTLVSFQKNKFPIAIKLKARNVLNKSFDITLFKVNGKFATNDKIYQKTYSSSKMDEMQLQNLVSF